MSFRRTFLAFALCVAAPALAAAQQTRQVEIGYEITFAGITGFRIDVTARLNGTAYDVESHTYKEGILRAVTMQYVGRNRGWGTMTPQGAQPRAGSMSLVIGGNARTLLTEYNADGSTKDTQTPEWKPAPAQSLTPEQRRGALDPMSAGLSAVLAGNAVCDRTVATFDGKRRIDVILKKAGTETAAASGIPGARGDVIVCDLLTRRVAGEFYDAPSEAESQRDRPMKLWLAHLDDSPIFYPAKLEAQTGFGTIHGRIVFFRERALTPTDIAAMPK
jgi:Protein of unknown function (DUF3108)